MADDQQLLPQSQIPDPEAEDYEDHPHPHHQKELQGTSASSSSSFSFLSSQDSDRAVPDPDATPPAGRASGNRKRPRPSKPKAAVSKKLRLLERTLRPVAFRPAKIIDFSKHETLFKRLGLWDFASLELDAPIRFDLLALLIANYNSSTRSSVVNHYRIKLNRADLARALNLPGKRDRMIVADMGSFNEPFSDESLSVLEDFLLNYVLLHEEDAWMIPDELLASVKLINEGHPEKVDFAWSVWFMVEKELSQSAKSHFVCYYASHLQLLMKCQKPELFKVKLIGGDVLVEEDEEETNVGVGGKSLEDLEGQNMENQETDLSTGFDKGEHEHALRGNGGDSGVCREGNNAQWVFNEKDYDNGEPCLEQCNSYDTKDDDERRYNSQTDKPKQLESLPLADLTQEVVTPINVSYGLSVERLDPSPIELMTSRVTTVHKNIQLTRLTHGGLSTFGCTVKREVHDEDDVPPFSQIDHHGSIKNVGPWSYNRSDFDICMAPMQMLVGKSKMMYKEKVQECARAQLQIQNLTTFSQQRETHMRALKKLILEEQNKSLMCCYHIQREMGVMTELINGYKKALKETRKAFSDYREKFKLNEEPLYKDVGRSGGLVFTCTDLEKLRLEKEEEERGNRCFVEDMVKDFEMYWVGVLKDHLVHVDLSAGKLKEIQATIEYLKPLTKCEKN